MHTDGQDNYIIVSYWLQEFSQKELRHWDLTRSQENIVSLKTLQKDGQTDGRTNRRMDL